MIAFRLRLFESEMQSSAKQRPGQSRPNFRRPFLLPERYPRLETLRSRDVWLLILLAQGLFIQSCCCDESRVSVAGHSFRGKEAVLVRHLCLSSKVELFDMCPV